MRGKFNSSKLPSIDNANLNNACPDLMSSGECDWIIAEAITAGFTSYEAAYAPDSWFDDDDINRLKELLNLKALRELSQIQTE